MNDSKDILTRLVAKNVAPQSAEPASAVDQTARLDQMAQDLADRSRRLADKCRSTVGIPLWRTKHG